MNIFEGSLEVKLPTIWADEKQTWEESEKRRQEERKSKKRKSQKKEDAAARKGRKVANIFFQWFVAPEGRKVGLLKRQLRSHLTRWEMKNCTPLRREAHSKSKCTKHTMLGPLLEVVILKKRTPLWREANFKINMLKTNTTYSDRFWALKRRFVWQAQGILHLV